MRPEGTGGARRWFGDDQRPGGTGTLLVGTTIAPSPSSMSALLESLLSGARLPRRDELPRPSQLCHGLCASKSDGAGGGPSRANHGSTMPGTANPPCPSIAHRRSASLVGATQHPPTGSHGCCARMYGVYVDDGCGSPSLPKGIDMLDGHQGKQRANPRPLPPLPPQEARLSHAALRGRQARRALVIRAVSYFITHASVNHGWLW